MKCLNNIKLLFSLLGVGFLLSCTKEPCLFFKNQQEIKRYDEVVVVKKEVLQEKVNMKSDYPLFKNKKGEMIPFQMDDMNNDGDWDEVALLLNFEPMEKKVVNVEFSEGENYPPKFQKRTNLRLGIKQNNGEFKEVDNFLAIPYYKKFKVIAQGESVNWENDKIGFRNYFDCRNVKDLFGKRLPKLIIDKIHTQKLGSYHVLADWGMDILHCGSSLGAGGIALLVNDSLYRLGSTDVFEYQKLTEGPVRSVFELRYKGWRVNSKELQAVEKISIYPGKYWFESDVIVKGCSGEAQIVTGIVTSLLKKKPFNFKANGFHCIGTHDVQSLNNDELGMAVIVPANEAGKIGRTTDINFFKEGFRTLPEKEFSNIISETYYIGQRYEKIKPAKHYFFSVWGLENDQWKTEMGFIDYIERETEKLSKKILLL